MLEALEFLFLTSSIPVTSFNVTIWMSMTSQIDAMTDLQHDCFYKLFCMCLCEKEEGGRRMNVDHLSIYQNTLII